MSVVTKTANGRRTIHYSKSGGKFVPGDTSDEDGVQMLEKAIHRMQTESSRVDHPLLGKLTGDEWTQFHLRHAEMHMSFLVTEDE